MSDELGLTQQAAMVAALRRRLAAETGCTVAQFETHISHVLVCGEHAFKFKKALKNAFLDQSTLAQRRWACEEELRLNRRLAPDLYLTVVPICGTPVAPEIAGQGVAFDVAVKMRSFAQDGLWDALAARAELGPQHIDALVQLLVPFHAAAAGAHGALGSPAGLRAAMLDNLAELAQWDASTDGRARLQRLRDWEAATFERLEPLMAQRLAQGRVRECHGDLHLGNVATVDGRTLVFDCIEFNDSFRWIDVMSELAFMAMDLHGHGLPKLAHRLVSGYLEAGGDYGGVELLDYYLVHRALVRAKVGMLRAQQSAAASGGATAGGPSTVGRYIDLALAFSRRGDTRAVLMLTHGFSGSGKSSLTLDLLGAIGAIRIRADVERKRLAGLQPLDHAGVPASPGLYALEMTAATYARLLALAAPVLRSGRHAILDATFLQRARRDAARQFAALQAVRCIVLDFEVEIEVLRQRLRERTLRGADPSDADGNVLAAQLLAAEPLQADELAQVFRCRCASKVEASCPQADWAPLLAWLAGGGIAVGK